MGPSTRWVGALSTSKGHVIDGAVVNAAPTVLTRWVGALLTTWGCVVDRAVINVAPTALMRWGGPVDELGPSSTQWEPH